METGEILCCGPSKYMEWKIDNFSSWMRRHYGCIQSPKFAFLGGIWNFRLYTHGERGNSAWVSIYLWRECPDDQEHCIIGCLGMKKSNGEEYVSHSFQHIFDADHACFAISKFLTRSSFLEDVAVHSPLNQTTFFCSLVCTSQGCKDVQTQTSQPEGLYEELKVTGGDGSEEVQCAWAKGIYKLAEDVKDLFLNKKNCDTTIKVANREFQAHRLILGARSPVFASMYSHDTTERSTGIVEIKDCTSEVFQDFLIFLYSGKLETLSLKNAFDLYAIADKYDVQEVKEECLKFMMSNLSVEHFGEVMALALKYSESELLKSATDFFVENARNISVTPDWLCFHRDYPVESNELHVKALERYAPK